MTSAKQAFNHQVVSYAKLYIDHEGRGSDLMGDPADWEIKSFAELGVADRAALHEFVRTNNEYKAYEAWDIHEATVDGVVLRSDEVNKTSKVFFGQVQSAESMTVYDPKDRGTPMDQRRQIPLVEEFPHHKGKTFFRRDGIEEVSEGESVYDPKSGLKLWPVIDTPPAPKLAA